MYVKVAHQYADDILSGKIASSKWVSHACQRFKDDLEKDWRWTFSEKHVEHVCKWLEMAVTHTKGPLAGENIRLEPWQVFCLANIYGWRDKRDTDIRKHQMIILEVARKNGKSLFASALALYDMVFGDEGSEVYSCATKADQAKICWNDAVRMVEKSHKKVKDIFKATVYALTIPERYSKYVYVGRDSKSLDGLNPSLTIFDEAAAYSDRNIVDVMTSAAGSRKNNIFLFITTAQFSRTTVYFENRMQMQNILSGKIEGDRWFGMIYCLEQEEDWTDKSNWIKANPNLGVSKDMELLEREVTEATQMQSKRNNVLVKHFNIFTTAEANWLDLAAWDKCKIDQIKTTGDFYVAMDSSSTRDLTALCYLWNAGDEFHVDYQCFLPRKSMEIVPVHLMPVYRQAVEDGTLRLTNGDVVDYREVKEEILSMAQNNQLKMIGYDKYNANLLVNDLEDLRLPTMDIAQGITALSPAAKETERLIVEKLVRHKDNPFISWQLENCVVYTDKNDNIKITKGEDASLKIDAIIAMIMAVSMAAGSLEEKGDFNLSYIQF